MLSSLICQCVGAGPIGLGQTHRQPRLESGYGRARYTGVDFFQASYLAGPQVQPLARRQALLRDLGPMGFCMRIAIGDMWQGCKSGQCWN